MDPREYRKKLRAKKAQLDEEGDPTPQSCDPQPKREVDESEVMATAFQALSTGTVDVQWDAIDVVQRAPAKPDKPPPAQAPGAGRDQIAPRADADPIPTKTQAPLTIDPSGWQGRDWRGQELGGGDVFGVENPFSKLDPQALAPEQRALLARIPKIPGKNIQTLNLRYLTQAQAKARLEATQTRMRALGQRYLRVITGKGIGSQGAPVLRQAVVHWCILQANRQALQWTPEPEFNREYGAIFVDLHRVHAQT